jgi:type IV secretory pathway VirB10-like protein
MSNAPTYLPPRQPHQPVQRIAKWALVSVSTVVIVGALYLFFRGTQPRRVSFGQQASTAAQRSPLADGWVAGLPDQPVSTEVPPKPPPPVDEEARRELRRLQKQQEERDEQHRKALEEIRKLLAEKKPAPTAKTIKRAPMLAVSHARKAEDITRPDDHLIAPGTFIQGTLQPTLNSEVEGYFTIKTTRRCSIASRARRSSSLKGSRSSRRTPRVRCSSAMNGSPPLRSRSAFLSGNQSIWARPR